MSGANTGDVGTTIAAPVRFSNVTKRYGPVTALDSVSLTLPHGEIVCLAGPNGSGKTTALRLIAGLTRPTSGSVTVPDEPLGISFQQPSAYPTLTVDENISIFGDLSDAASEWRDTLVERLGLGPVRQRPTDELSDGFRKKLDLVLALLKRPSICLFDEPLADLDDVSRSGIVGLLDQYAGEDRIVIVSSHRIERFDDLLDRLVILRHGDVLLDRSRAEFTDTPSATYRHALDVPLGAVGDNA